MRIAKLSSVLTSCLVIGTLAGNFPAFPNDDQTRTSFAEETAKVTPYTEVRRDNLLNGLQIVTLEQDGDQNLTCDIIIRAGSMFDLVAKTGLAVLTQESLLAVNPRLKEELSSLEAKIEWGVDWDTTWFRIETPPANFELALEIFARLVVVENVRANAFTASQQVQIEKIQSRPMTPAERADQSFYNALYGTHPYGHNLLGTPATVNNISQADVYDFARRFYVANNASAVISGNVTRDRVLQAFKILFGGWMKGEIIPATFRPPRQIKQAKLVKIDQPDLSKVELRSGILGVSFGEADYVITDLLARILTARLQTFPETSGFDFTVKAEPRVLPGPFLISASLPAEAAQGFSQRMTDSLVSLVKNPVPNAELEAAKAAMAAEYGGRSIAENLRLIETYSLPRNYPVKIEDNIKSITSADVQRVAKSMFESNALTVVVLGKVNEDFKTTP